MRINIPFFNNKFIICFLFLFCFLASQNLYTQSGWYNTFINNTSGISSIVQIDNSNYLALCGQYYFKSTDGGNTWISNKFLGFDSVYWFGSSQFINSQTGYLAGSNSSNYEAIMKTTNGGLNWSRLQTGYSPSFTCSCLFFLNENTGWIGSSGGTNGRLYKTTNGGFNWVMQEFSGMYYIGSVKFFDVNNGWILGEYFIAKTTNGGLNWIQTPINNIPCSNSFYRNLFPLSMNESWALVTCCPNYTLVFSHFFKTTNGGDNWNLMYSYTDSLQTNSHSFWKIYFDNSSTGFSDGEFHFIIRTTNSGLNWNTINFSSLGISPLVETLLPLNNNTVFAGGGATYWFGEDYPYNCILKSINNGTNWAIQSYNWEYNFSKVFFINNYEGFVLADSGKVFKTTNNGTNWNLIFNNSSVWSQDLFFSNYLNGCIVVGNSYYNDYSKILRTTNGGNNWAEVFNLNKPVYKIIFIDQQNGIAGCDSNRILRTTDAGLTWYYINLYNSKPCQIIGISFINSSMGWILGHIYYGSITGSYEKNAIWKTTNGGNNWNLIFDSLGYCYNYYVKFTNNDIGYKSIWGTPNQVQKTTNGGVNWYRLSTPYIDGTFSIDFINENIGWIVGRNEQNYHGEVIKTTDGGNNWILQYNAYNRIVYSIDALDENNAWFCGDYSSVYSTTNGGGVIGIKFIEQNKIPNSFSLFQNYPNPFNPTTKIKFDVPSNVKGETSNVKLIIYDILGREVVTLVNEELKPGSYEYEWDGSRFASGVYFYQILANGYSDTKKLILLK